MCDLPIVGKRFLVARESVDPHSPSTTIKRFLIESSVVEVAYLPSLLAEWELKSPADKCPVSNE